MSVLVFDATGVLLKTAPTDAAGTYTVAGLPTGTYFVRTNSNAATQNYVAQCTTASPSPACPCGSARRSP